MNNDQIKPKGTADGVPVYCSHDAIVKTADMKPNPKNPNQHPEEQLRRLRRHNSRRRLAQPDHGQHSLRAYRSRTRAASGGSNGRAERSAG